MVLVLLLATATSRTDGPALACAMDRAARAQAVQHDMAVARPRTVPVVLDGDLAEWDRSAALDFAYDQALAPRFTGRLLLMYDARALYVGAHMVDDSPLANEHPARGAPDER